MKRYIKLLSYTLVMVMLATAALVGCSSVGSGDGSTAQTPAQTPSDTPADTPTEPEAQTPSDTEKEDDPEPVKSDFEIYRSNTVCPTGNNSVMRSESGEAVTGTFRGMFKAQTFGTHEYKLYFSNNVDSTWGNGSVSYRGMKTKPYNIISASAYGTSRNIEGGTVSDAIEITFGGSASRKVAAGESFWCDPFELEVPENGYIMFEWTVEYTMIPSTKVNSTYIALQKSEGQSRFSIVQEAPFPELIGCNREDLRVAFWGDSITMGEGAGEHYKSWAAQISAAFGSKISAWNLGLGYGRVEDAVNSPSWIEKAKNNDVVIICFGVNDINSGGYNTGLRSASQIEKDISTIAKACADAGCEIILFSTPPYTYSNSNKINTWYELNKKLLALAEKNGYEFFDFAACLGKSDDPSVPAYGGHPNATGCTVVAQEFIKSELIDID